MKNIIVFFCLLVACGSEQKTNLSHNEKGLEDAQKIEVNNSKTEEKIVNDLYSIEIDQLLSKTTTLNDEASLQYQNPGKELYIIVIDETKESFGASVEQYGEEIGISENTFRTYADFLLSDYEKVFPTDTKPSKKSKKINGLTAEIYTYNTTFNNLPITMKLAMIEGQDHYYQIMTWTLARYEAEHLDKMNTMINSFKEI